MSVKEAGKTDIYNDSQKVNYSYLAERREVGRRLLGCMYGIEFERGRSAEGEEEVEGKGKAKEAERGKESWAMLVWR